MWGAWHQGTCAAIHTEEYGKTMLSKRDGQWTNFSSVTDLEGTCNVHLTMPPVLGGSEVPRGVLTENSVSRMRLSLIQVIQRAADNDLPLSFWKGGKLKTAEAVAAHSVDVDDLRFPSTMIVVGVTTPHASQSLRHALPTFLAHTVVPAGVSEWLDQNVRIHSAAQLAQVDTDIETFRTRGRGAEGGQRGATGRGGHVGRRAAVTPPPLVPSVVDSCRHLQPKEQEEVG